MSWLLAGACQETMRCELETVAAGLTSRSSDRAAQRNADPYAHSTGRLTGNTKS